MASPSITFAKKIVLRVINVIRYFYYNLFDLHHFSLDIIRQPRLLNITVLFTRAANGGQKICSFLKTENPISYSMPCWWIHNHRSFLIKPKHTHLKVLAIIWKIVLTITQMDHIVINARWPYLNDRNKGSNSVMMNDQSSLLELAFRKRNIFII